MNSHDPQPTFIPQTKHNETHPVFNVATALEDINLFNTDSALQEAVQREGASWATAALTQFGALTGSSAYLHLGHLANKHKPELDTHDRFGNRVDVVHYHPAYHELMRSAFANQLHAEPWLNPVLGAHVVRAAKYIMQSQVETGHICPTTMTFASIPTIRATPALAAMWEDKILSRDYDPRNLPAHMKNGLSVGMGMTEKQGGSDVRANTTVAKAINARITEKDQLQEYEITGHKWFLSAPMCDFFLILAQTETGVSCFLVPRWQPDGSKNSLEVIRLKNKMANLSNASSEVEFRGAFGWLVGDEGRGVATIIEMVSLTRFDCMLGSSAIMRMGLIQAIHHCKQREAFGKKLIDQPLMQNVLADLALEYEAALVLSMRMARALDEKDHDTDAGRHEALLARIVTAIGKYWICKRTPNHSYEAMEVIGGNGVMEDGPMPRLYREAVINSIWEGSGNVQCLDVLRAIHKTPETLQAYFNEVSLASGKNALFDSAVSTLKAEFANTEHLEFRARTVVDQLAIVLQAALLLQHAPDFVSHAFCQSRLGQQGAHNYGTLPVDVDAKAIIARSYMG